MGRWDSQRTVVACEECGELYAAEIWPSGKIALIGRRNCRCGSKDFAVVDRSERS